MCETLSVHPSADGVKIYTYFWIPKILFRMTSERTPNSTCYKNALPFPVDIVLGTMMIQINYELTTAFH
jgi:hypothetical protein